MRLRSESGFGLLLMTGIIVIAGILLMASARFLTNQTSEMHRRVNETKAHYLAQGGVMQAIYNWYTSNAAEANRTYTNIATTVVSGSNQYRTGVDADFAYFDHTAAIWVRTTGAACTQAGSTCLRLGSWSIKNMRPGGGANITVTHCRISWTGGAQTVAAIRLNNAAVYAGAGANGALLDITDTALAPGATFSGANTYIDWSAQPNGTGNIAVTIQWTFSDNSATVDSTTRHVPFWNSVATSRPVNGRPAQRSFQITSTGQVKETAAANTSVVRTVRAVVAGNVAPPEIIDWDDLGKNLAIT